MTKDEFKNLKDNDIILFRIKNNKAIGRIKFENKNCIFCKIWSNCLPIKECLINIEEDDPCYYTKISDEELLIIQLENK